MTVSAYQVPLGCGILHIGWIVFGPAKLIYEVIVQIDLRRGIDSFYVDWIILVQVDMCGDGDMCARRKVLYLNPSLPLRHMQSLR